MKAILEQEIFYILLHAGMLSSLLLHFSGVIVELILSVVISVGEKKTSYRKTWRFEGRVKVENS